MLTQFIADFDKWAAVHPTMATLVLVGLMNHPITLTIDKNGDQVFLKGHGADVFTSIGRTVIRRASHVEPDGWLLRQIFRAIRFCVRDTSTIAAWTRTWWCHWRVNTKPVGGPILWDRFLNREAAIEAERKFLDNHIFTRRTQ